MVSGIRFSLPKSLSCRFYKLINISGDCTYISPEECHFHGKYVNYSSCLRSVCGMVCRILGSFSSHMVFPVVIYKCESWTIKKAEQQRIDAFELWFWRRLFRVPWQIDGEKVETVSDFIFLGSQITEDGDCSQEIKRCLLLGRKVMTNLDSILKSRDITLLTKIHLVKAMVFQVVMYGCESWTIRNAECRRIDAFELWCWRRLLRLPWTARRSH